MKIGCDLIRDLKMYKLPLEKFRQFNDRLVFIDPNKLPSDNILNDIEIYIGDRITTDMVKYMPNLKWIHLTCVGVDKLLGLDRNDIIITNSKGIMDKSVISTILAFMFSLSRGINYCLKENLDRYKFDRYFDNIQAIDNQTCLIVGMGNIGNKLKSILELLNINVVGIKSDNADDLIHLIKDADFVINLLPLTNKTKDIFNKKIFEYMQKSSYFINVGRGQTVVEEDLIYALKHNIIAGAALDVFEHEPLSLDSDLWNLKNVILTPHVAGLSKDYWDKEYELFLENYKRYQNSKEMLNYVKL